MIDRILIADDHSMVRYGLSRLLARLSPQATIEEADSFRSVLDMIKKIDLDLIFLDVNMPDGNFQQTFDIIKAKQPNVKIIIFSAQEVKVDKNSLPEHVFSTDDKMQYKVEVGKSTIVPVIQLEVQKRSID